MKESNSKYHSWLKKIMSEFSQENKIKLEEKKGSFKITSDKKRTKSVIEYDPDYAFKFKTGKKSVEWIIFEFLDKQVSEGIIADIVECSCIGNCRLLIFISKTDEKHKEAIKNINVIGDFLDEINGEKVLDMVSFHIPQETGKEEVKDLFYKEISKIITLPKQPFIFGKSRLGNHKCVLN